MSMPPTTLLPDHVLYGISNACEHEKMSCICTSCKCIKTTNIIATGLKINF